MMKKFYTVINTNPLTNAVDIYIYMCGEDGSIDVMEYDIPKQVHYTEDSIMKGEVKPSIRFSGNMAVPLLKSLSQSIEHFGIKAEDQSKIEGELIATKLHLQDLRQLLKIK